MLSNPINIIIISLITAAGVVHDMRIDRVAAIALPTTVISSQPGDRLGGPEINTHVAERSSIAQAIRDLEVATPRIQPRTEDKKHLLQARVVRGHHAFDHYYLPE